MTAATKATPAAVRSAAAHKAAPKAPKATPTEIVAKVRGTFGTADGAVKAITVAHDAVQTADNAVLAWAAAAVAWDGSARDFGALATESGDKNILGRLRAVASLLAASKKGKGTRALTAVEAVRVANAKSLSAISAMCDEMDKGGDPLGSKAKRPGAVKPNTGVSRKAKVTTTAPITPDQFADVLKFMLANVDKVSRNSSAVDIANVASALAKAATARAAALAAPASTKAKAAKAAAAA